MKKNEMTCKKLEEDKKGHDLKARMENKCCV